MQLIRRTLDAFIVFPLRWYVHRNFVPMVGLKVLRKNKCKITSKTKTCPCCDVEIQDDHENGSLTRWPDGLALLGRLKVLLEGFLKGWLTDTRGAPSLELNVFGIVQSMGEEHRGEVNVCKVTTSEVSCAIVGEAFDPLCPRGCSVHWIVSVSVSAAHRDKDERLEGTCGLTSDLQNPKRQQP